MTHPRETIDPVRTPGLDELLQRIATSDAHAFSRFYDVTAGRVFPAVLRVVRDRPLAEEVCREVFVEVWRKAATYDPARASASTWLLMLAHRRAVDRVRSVQASGDRDLRVATGPEHEQVRGALRRLSRIQREAIHLTYVQGLTYRDAAAQLGKPIGTVKSRLRDGLRQLGEHLAAGPSRT